MNLSKTAKRMKGGAIEIFKNNILHNSIVLYSLFILSLLYLLYFSTINDYSLVAIFVLTGFITSFFSKNMVVILCISLIVSFLLRQGTRDLEGFEERKESMTPLETAPIKAEPSKSSSPGLNDEISMVKAESEDLKKTLNALDSSKTKLPPEELEQLKDSYKELHSVGTKLLGTQEKIIQNFEKIEPLIKDAENLVDSMNKAVDNMKTIAQKRR